MLGRVAASDRGLLLVFEREEAIMFVLKKEEFVDPVIGETKKRQVKYYPDAYKNRIGRSYTEYEHYRQLNLEYSGVRGTEYTEGFSTNVRIT